MTSAQVPADRTRERLCLALDVPDLASARSLAKSLRPWFAVVKVGLELYVAEGPAAVAAFIEDGFDVFVDLKLHDIPTTVQRAARAIARTGARYATVHAAGGGAMLAAAAEGFAEGAAAAGQTSPTVGLAVTVLTSDADATPALVVARSVLAARSGCGGVICAVADVASIRAAVPGMITVVPGVRPAGTSRDDQSRVGTPQDALLAGADLLVLGRAITRAKDPMAAARDLAGSLHSLASP